MPANRQERIDYAQQILDRKPYTSKRALQRAVKARYGVGLSDTYRRDLIRPAKQAEFTRRAIAISPVVVKPRIRKPKRQQRYEYLINAHFTPDEALRFSRIRNIKKNFAFIGGGNQEGMIAERRQLFTRFLERAGQRGWGIQKQRREWANTISKWYKDNGLLTRKGKLSPWSWYNKTSDNLPHELQDEYPRPHSRKRQDLPTIKKIDRSRWINQLRQRIAVEPDPKRRADFRRQIARHRRGIDK